MKLSLSSRHTLDRSLKTCQLLTFHVALPLQDQIGVDLHLTALIKCITSYRSYVPSCKHFKENPKTLQFSSNQSGIWEYSDHRFLASELGSIPEYSSLWLRQPVPLRFVYPSSDSSRMLKPIEAKGRESTSIIGRVEIQQQASLFQCTTH